MNLHYQQLVGSNPLPGFVSASLDSHESVRKSQLAALQVNPAVAPRVDELAVIQDLRSLREEEKDSEAPIAIRAFSEAMSLLEFVHLVVGNLPRTLLIPSGQGGITVEWFRNDRTVRAIIPPRTDQGYVYERVGRHSNVKPFSKSAVVQSLRTLIR